MSFFEYFFLVFFLVIETTQKARDNDLTMLLEEFYADGFLDETRRSTHKTQRRDSVKSKKDEVENGEKVVSVSSSLESSTSTDENDDSGGSVRSGLGRYNKPRRARTYHGTADSQSKQRLILIFFVKIFYDFLEKFIYCFSEFFRSIHYDSTTYYCA